MKIIGTIRPGTPLDSRIIFALLAALSAIPFLFSIRAPFFVIDDYQYIEGNQWIQTFTAANIMAIFTRPYLHNYLPFHLLNYAFDHLLWGNNPMGYLIENVIWHAGCVCMAFVVLRRLARSEGAAFVGALFFGLHPACVESVAWVAERKNMMSQFFGLLSFWLYITRGEGRRRYFASVLVFLAALLSKMSVVVMPILLMIYQWAVEDERNWRKLVLDKIPFFALAFFMGLATVVAQDINPAKSEVRGGGVLATIFTMAVVWLRYVGMTLWPIRLSATYEVIKWGLTPVSAIAAAIICLIIAVALKARHGRPLITLGALWFFLSLLPVSNIFPLPVVLKDRYLYLPLIGAGMVIGDLWGRSFVKEKRLSLVLMVLMVVSMMALTAQQDWFWRTPETTWRRAVRVAPMSVDSRASLATVYLRSRQFGKLYEQSGIARLLKNNLPPDRILVARHYLENGQPYEALYMAKKMLPADPDNPKLLATLGMAFLYNGQDENAEAPLRRAIELGSTEALPYLGMGLLALGRGENELAIKLLGKALEIDPKQVDAHLELGSLLEQSDPREALMHFSKALELAPERPDKAKIQEAIIRAKRKLSGQ